MRNPRRDALEYGILLATTASVAVAYGVLAYVRFNNVDPERKLRVDLTKPVDFREAARELRELGRRRRGGDGDGSAN
eukprot:CAMPEP_0116826146 /NCGR_PEP_ID=MMETSP0418-20121206/2366_1 /TAXON_ID=1158023 /ORGANISM="Astrosyne radiata, Strain 13vi08-1A" /LENGTH=76 /DNA_ID=CAMNT_0004454747 /DNA_START=23 /DNA_END=253 /DNA_ORIENTATION=+